MNTRKSLIYQHFLAFDSFWKFADIKIQISHSPPKNTENYVLGIFLSKPQVWYIITLCVYIITEGVSHLPQAASYFRWIIRNRMIQNRCHSQEIRDHRAYTTNRFGSSPKRRCVNGFLIFTHKSDDFLQPPLSFMLCQIPFLPIQSDHTYIVKNFGSSESRFAADA